MRSRWARILMRATATAATILALQLPVIAQPAMEVYVPFDFYVANTFMPAGAYTVTPDTNGNAVRVKGSFKEAASIVVIRSHRRRDEPKTGTQLVFHRYPGASFLAELQIADRGTSLVLARSGTERRVRRHGPAIRVTTQPKS